ncbi:hypothetical protein DVA86_13305 [Streptomyces armeniacus]|uniref:CHAT domain-containing protein n=1 Tax=Streptomyces armeniacus TaxID=83291 RepID=A0A345XPB7_9ACTN|nr:hypothetical protein [Streptomyces armeniacus]AXK33483.1 hypothetical protein DVA86_13305 [Streptomyces armeniacus]
MSTAIYRRQLEQRRKDLAGAQKKAGEFRKKESDKRTAANKAREAAGKKSGSMAASKQREASRHEAAATAASKSASTWDGKVARFLKEIGGLEAKLAKAEAAERAAADKVRQREQEQAERRAALAQQEIEGRLSTTEGQVSTMLEEIRAPRPEKLRILLLGASSEGDLRVGREQQRIRAAVQAATHRDLVELEVHPAATTAVFLDALPRFRPHVVHFSGHSAENLIAFEKDEDDFHESAIVNADAFARAIAAVDDKPLLVLLNSCDSAAQAMKLIDTVPFAIGMSDTIDDGDAVNYAARFYATVAEGQSVQAAHLFSQAAMEMNGLSGHDLPTLNCAPNVDPAVAKLVTPPPE